MRVTVTPSDVGLPAGKFGLYRRGQFEAAEALLASDKRFSLLDAATGAGKSIIYMTLAKLMAARTLVLVGTKGLQQQLMADFAAAGMVDMRGQGNYPCVAADTGGHLAEYGRPGIHCDEGPCRVGVHCSMREGGGCYYYDQQEHVRNSTITVSNYSYWLTLGRHSDPVSLGEYDLLILDEAHTAPDWLTEHCAVSLDRSELRSLLDLELPPLNEGVEAWSVWARVAATVARERYVEARSGLVTSIAGAGIRPGGNTTPLRGRTGGMAGRAVYDSVAPGAAPERGGGAGDGHDTTRRGTTRHMLRLIALERDLNEMAKASSWQRSEGAAKDARVAGMQVDWVAEETPKGAKFSPVWAHAYAEPYLFRGIPRVVMSSATLSPVVARYLGIPPNQHDYHEIKSGFDPKRRPFIHVPTVRVDRRMLSGDQRILLRRVDEIIGGRLDRKGIIHTRSYDRMRWLVDNSRHRDIMVYPERGRTREAVARYIRAKPPCVLVSPALEEGFDFPGDMCRYQIILKVPFVDGRGPIAKARAKTDRDYAVYQAALALVQMAGRGMRSAEDLCENYLIDDHWFWFRKKAVFPGWFKQAWLQMSTVPLPPALPEAA